MVNILRLLFALAAAESDPVFGPKDKVEIRLSPEPLKTAEFVKDLPDRFSLVRDGDDFQIFADIRVDGGLKTCGLFNSRLSVDFDGDTVSEFHITPSGHVLTRSFDNGNAIHFSHLVSLRLCRGNIKSCVLTSEQMSSEDLKFDVSFAGLKMGDSGKQIKLDFSCDDVIRDSSTSLHVWKEGQIEITAGLTTLDSSDDVVQTVATCNLTDLSPAVEMATFLIGDFKKISQVKNGIAELRISGIELITFGGRNIHGKNIECEAIQMTDLSEPPTLLKKYRTTTKETIAFSYPTTFAKVSFENTKFVRGMNYLQKGESAEISCEFDGFPLPSPRLSVDGHEVRSNAFKIEDDASITCEAGNFADTAYVNVYYLEEDSVELTLVQDPDEIYEGDIIELACHAHGSPLPDFTFYRSAKTLSEDDHHHYQAAVRAGNYSCAASLDDFGLEYGSNVIEIIPKMRPDGFSESLGLSAGHKIAIFIICIILLIIVLLVIDFLVYKEKGLTNEALLKLNCYCCKRDALPKKEETDEENPEQENIVKDSHDDDVISTKSSEKPEIDPDAASQNQSSKS